MASSWRFIWQGSHGRSSRSGIPSIIPSPPALCDRVLRLPDGPLFTAHHDPAEAPEFVTGCCALRDRVLRFT